METEAREAKPRQASPLAFARFAATFWTTGSRRTAWLLTISLAVIMSATLAVNLGLNYWNRWFFDALEQRDTGRLWSVLAWLPPLIVCGAALAVATVRTRMALQVRWRAFVTHRMLALWLGDQRYYRLALADRTLDNAEHRIADDVHHATEPMVDLAVGFVWSLASALAFIGVLISVGGSLSVLGIAIPGYLAFAALLYAAIVCGITILIGRPLAGRVADKNETEAQLRYELTRVRENAESIALMHGDAREQAQTGGRLDVVVGAWFEVIRHHGRLTWILNSNSFLAPIAPAILATPKFLAGELTLGGVLQIVAAFGAVLGALNWFAENYIRLAEVAASAGRAEELRQALVELDDDAGDASLPAIAVSRAAPADTAVELENVTLRKSDGVPLVHRANIRILAGQKVLVEGKSGSGKSTLLRALGGLWPWGTGTIRLPRGARIAFVPQRPYVPIGKLRDALIYPSTETPLDHQRCTEIFVQIGLGHLLPRLDDVDTWDRILSGGERQRLAFGRLLIQRPDIVVLDEATSALDDEGQHAMFALLAAELPEATVINVAHRQGLEEFHDRKLTIDASSHAPRLSWTTLAGRGRRLVDLFRRTRRTATPVTATPPPAPLATRTPRETDRSAKP